MREIKQISIIAFKVMCVALLTLVLTIAPVYGQDKKSGPEKFTATETEQKAVSAASERINRANKAYQDALKQAELIVTAAQKEAEAAQAQGQIIVLQIGKAHGCDVDDYEAGQGDKGELVFTRKKAQEKGK